MTRLSEVPPTCRTAITLPYVKNETVALAGRDHDTDDCARATIAAGVVATSLSLASSLAGLVTLGGAFLAGALGCYTVGITALCIGSPSESSSTSTSRTARRKLENAADAKQAEQARLKREEFAKKLAEIRKKRDAIPFTFDADDVKRAERKVERCKLWVETYAVTLESSKFEEGQAKLDVARAEQAELYSGDLASSKETLERHRKYVEEDEKTLKTAKEELVAAETALAAAKQAAKQADLAPAKVVFVPNSAYTQKPAEKAKHLVEEA